jgi:hypothetical protein
MQDGHILLISFNCLSFHTFSWVGWHGIQVHLAAVIQCYYVTSDFCEDFYCNYNLLTWNWDLPSSAILVWHLFSWPQISKSCRTHRSRYILFRFGKHLHANTATAPGSPQWVFVVNSSNLMKHSVNFLRLISIVVFMCLFMSLQTHVISYSRSSGKDITVYSTYFRIDRCTERRGRVVNTPASYSGGPGFKFGLEIGYRGWGFSWFYSVPPGRIPE